MVGNQPLPTAASFGINNHLQLRSMGHDYDAADADYSCCCFCDRNAHGAIGTSLTDPGVRVSVGLIEQPAQFMSLADAILEGCGAIGAISIGVLVGLLLVAIKDWTDDLRRGL
jgi:hypothetical protein